MSALLAQPRLPSSWRTMLWSGIAAMLLLPAVAMQFTHQVAWGAEDFAAALLLLGGFGVAVEVAFRVTQHATGRLAIAGGALLIVLLLWAEAAVGIF